MRSSTKEERSIRTAEKYSLRYSFTFVSDLYTIDMMKNIKCNRKETIKSDTYMATLDAK